MEEGLNRYQLRSETVVFRGAARDIRDKMPEDVFKRWYNGEISARSVAKDHFPRWSYPVVVTTLHAIVKARHLPPVRYHANEYAPKNVMRKQKLARLAAQEREAERTFEDQYSQGTNTEVVNKRRDEAQNAMCSSVGV